MKVTVDGKVYEYDPDTLRNDEAMGIETALGVTFKRWGELLADGSVSALTALVWVVRKREEPALRFADVTFEFGNLQIDGEEDAVVDPTPVEPETASA